MLLSISCSACIDFPLHVQIPFYALYRAGKLALPYIMPSSSGGSSPVGISPGGVVPEKEPIESISKRQEKLKKRQEKGGIRVQR